MKSSAILSVAAVASVAIASDKPTKRNGVTYGFDVSGYQPNVDFTSAYNGGLRFVYIKVCSHRLHSELDPLFADICIN